MLHTVPARRHLARRTALRAYLGPALIAWGIVTVFVALATGDVQAQDIPGVRSGELVGEGWRGFTNVRFLLHALSTLLLAAALGAVLAYHPFNRRAIDTIEESEAPKVYITYAVVGAIIGIMVLEYGLVIGFVVFGIGGLIRFRTALPSAIETGRLIFITLIGLSAGLDLPHLAVLATAFGFGMKFLLERKLTYRIRVKGVEEEDIEKVAAAYLSALEHQQFKIVREKRNLAKKEIAIIFQTSARVTREEIEERFDTLVPHRHQGIVDWEIA